ncbi:MAG: (d)CMP kinase [Bryobacteraceae bacterium]
MGKRIVVAIDGPAGAGKSTIARAVAGRLGFLYIDSGAMYRAVGLWALRAGLALDDARSLEQLARASRIELEQEGSRVLLNGEDVTEAIRTPEVSQAASKVSAFGGVRRAMVEEQRRMAERTSVVMEGRDIGTVVYPEADVKIFLDADPAERAARRLRESAGKGEPVDPEELARQIRERDERDRNRSEAPLVQAPDAFYLDSTGLTIDQVEERILKLIRERTSNGKEVSN